MKKDNQSRTLKDKKKNTNWFGTPSPEGYTMLGNFKSLHPMEEDTDPMLPNSPNYQQRAIEVDSFLPYPQTVL